MFKRQYKLNRYKLLENKNLILANFLTLNRKKFAIVDDLNERQDFVEKSKTALKELIRSSIFKFPVSQQNASKTIDDSLDDASYLPKPIEETELADS